MPICQDLLCPRPDPLRSDIDEKELLALALNANLFKQMVDWYD